MQNESQRQSIEQPPVLAHSTAAREATAEDATPRHLVKKCSSLSPVRPGNSRCNSASTVSKDSNLLRANVVEVSSRRPMPAPQQQSSDLGFGVASPVTPAKPPGPSFQTQFRQVPSTAWAAFPVIVANETLFSSWIRVHDCRPPSIFKVRSDDEFDRFSLASATEFRAGFSEKHFSIHTDLLVKKSPYFAAMQNTPQNPQPPNRLKGPFHFRDFDEFAFALFVHWMYGGDLQGPHDFHSMNHYLCLYVFADKFQIELLQNNVMDLVRGYYHRENMTAPAFRLEFVYSHTGEPGLMRRFLVMTAAFRALSDCEHQGGISESIRDVLKKGGDLASDFADGLCTLVKNEREDVRKGDPCHWHYHDTTTRCKPWKGPEPYDSPE